MSKAESLYQLKVTLKNVKPPVWRRLLLSASATFWELHLAIQDSFGWADYHLHEFYLGSPYDRKAQNIKIPYPDDDDFWDNGKEALDESITLLADHLSEKQPKATYIYDFGDNWEHQIVLEKELAFDPKKKYPQVIDGKRACPWEDSGGPWGYEDKIKIIKNKRHKEHKEIMEWVGIENINELDLESFDPKTVIFRNPKKELKELQKNIQQEFR